jgi:hypothetical protein
MAFSISSVPSSAGLTMSQPNAPTPPEGDDASFEAEEEIQFDQAEYATPASAGPTCGLCHQPIADTYYETGGKVFCTACRGRIEESFRGGSRLGRALKAFVFGSAAALAGGALYYAIIRTTGINLGLIAVLVGYMVGRAVRAGSGNRGGLLYQFLAVFLTYSSIVAMHVPLLVEHALKQGPPKDEQAKVAPAKDDADRARAKDKALAGEKDKAALNAADAPRQGRPPLSRAEFLLALVRVIGFFYSLPVHLAMAAPISGLIFGFALWEAWKIPTKIQFSFNGPFRVATEPLNVPNPEDFDDGR